jgi:protein-L-isoaspartate O-methyltransferase
MFLYAATIFVSAFLLFLVQPIIAKLILPWFGGTAAVWTTCLVFFQTTLLLGYFYSDWTTRKLSPRTQAVVHIALLIACLLLLPITPDASWKPVGGENPGLRILLLLGATIGLPYFLLSATSPLIQAWFARTYPDSSPYRLFALSNLASMLALLGYPFILEPWVSALNQAGIWSVGFALFAVLCAFAAWFAMRNKVSAYGANADAITAIGMNFNSGRAPTPTVRLKLTWIALAGLGSVLLLAISNHLTQNISSIPLLWILPLSIYLITFILCFDGQGWYPRPLYLPLLAVVLVAMAWTLADSDLNYVLFWQIGLFSAGLFVTCMFCHGELVRAKPASQYLTTFYLMVSLGGALGAALVGIVAPITLPAYFELEIALVLVALMALYLLWGKNRIVAGLAIIVALFTLGAGAYTIKELIENTMVMKRNFYGTLRVKEFGVPSEESHNRTLVHGTILHGEQYLHPKFSKAATSYYQTTSGIGRAILLKQQLMPESPMRIGVIGLGTGTIAAYGRKGDTIRFYDINPAVVTIARRDFTYLNESDATIEIALGDARLSMEREHPQLFDVLVIDAFSGDSIPVHLITYEAVELYMKHLKEDGVIAFHVSNRFLDLTPVVQQIADKHGLHAAWIHEDKKNDDGSVRTISDWVLLSRNKTFLLRDQILDATFVIPPQPGWRLWTDDFNNLLQVLR